MTAIDRDSHTNFQPPPHASRYFILPLNMTSSASEQDLMELSFEEGGGTQLGTEPKSDESETHLCVRTDLLGSKI